MCITFFALQPYHPNTKLSSSEHNQQQYSSNQINEQEQLCDNNKSNGERKIKTKIIHKLHNKCKSKGKSDPTYQKQDEEIYQQKEQNEKGQNKNEEKQKESKQNAGKMKEGKKKSIKFIIAFNRDEQAGRRTNKMGPFAQDANIIAGRDTKSTGTWLGINIKTGIMVILTNYDLPVFRPGKSRGQLVQHFLKTSFVDQQHLQEPQKVNAKIHQQLALVLKQTQSKLYPAFNLMVYNIRNDSIFYICSELHLKQPILLQKHKMYGLCNTDLFTIWPKTEHGINIFKHTLSLIQDKQDEDILGTLAQKVMKDSKRFSKNLDDEAAIFIQPFFSTIEKAERMTKTTFVAIIRQVQDTILEQSRNIKNNPKYEIVMREITHINNKYGERNKSQHKYSTRKNPNPQQKIQQEDYDHIEEVVKNFKFLI